MVWIECAIWELGNLFIVYHSLLCERAESRFWMPKTFDEEKVCVVNSIP